MDAAELDARWTEFIATQGAEVEREILTELEETAHLFDTTDGTHAKWSPDGILGLLSVCWLRSMRAWTGSMRRRPLSVCGLLP